MKALITGATHGLGAEIAKAFWDMGIELCLVGRDETAMKEITERLKGSDGYLVDLLIHDDLIALFRGIEGVFPDIVVNCAASIGPIGKFIDNEWAEWRDTIELDLMIPARICWHCIPTMKRRSWGKIINVSGGGATKGMPNFSAYASAKTALVRFTETIAEELKPFHVDVNAVAPGAMNSGITKEILAAGREGAGDSIFDEAVKTANYNYSPDAAARLCSFLASHDSDGITGRLISALHDPWPTWGKDTKLEPGKYTLRRAT